jgi:hypothetical protein
MMRENDETKAVRHPELLLDLILISFPFPDERWLLRSLLSPDFDEVAEIDGEGWVFRASCTLPSLAIVLLSLTFL